MLKIGLFDPGFFNPDQPPSRANLIIDELFSIVPKVESLGFSRYWLGEHHEYGSAWRNSEILLALLSGMTERIRVGVAGVLLNLYSPLLIAQNFKLLEYLFSGRIDLGVAKGVAPKSVMAAMQIDWNIQQQSYEAKLDQLVKLLNGELVANGISIPPYYHGHPPIWILGTSTSSMPLVLMHKANFCLSLFHKISDLKNGVLQLNKLRSAFEDKWNVQLKCTIAVAGICASSMHKAQSEKSRWKNDFILPLIEGGPKECFEQLSELQFKYDLDEIIFLNLCGRYEDKIEGYSHLSEVFCLTTVES